MHKQIQVSLEQGTGPKPRTKDVVWKGSTLRLYTIGWLRYLTFLADVTLRGWERKEILPKPIMTLAGGTRWYTPAELIVYSSLIRQHYSTGRNLIALKARLATAYIDIRKKYLKMKEGETLATGFDVLQNENAVEQAFTKSGIQRKLDKDHFHEIKALIDTTAATPGNHQASPNHSTVSRVSVDGGKLRDRHTVRKQSSGNQKGAHTGAKNR